MLRLVARFAAPNCRTTSTSDLLPILLTTFRYLLVLRLIILPIIFIFSSPCTSPDTYHHTLSLLQLVLFLRQITYIHILIIYFLNLLQTPVKLLTTKHSQIISYMSHCIHTSINTYAFLLIISEHAS